MRALALVCVLMGCDRVLGLTEIAGGRGDAASNAIAFLYQDEKSVTGSGDTAQIVEVPVALPAGAPPGALCVTTIWLSGSVPPPTVSSVAFDAMPLSKLAAVVGVTNAGGDNATRTEQWDMFLPATSGTISVSIANPGSTIHVGVMVFVGVDPVSPPSSPVTASGVAASSKVTVASAPGDMIECVTGQGTGVTSAATPFTYYTDDHSASSSLDNTGYGYQPADPSTTTVTWNFAGSDEFQTIAVALHPAS